MIIVIIIGAIILTLKGAIVEFLFVCLLFVWGFFVCLFCLLFAVDWP